LVQLEVRESASNGRSLESASLNETESVPAEGPVVVEHES